MNKKAFIGATLVTATVVGGVVYYRHKIMERLDKWLDDEDMSQDQETALAVWEQAIREQATGEQGHA